MMYYKTSSSQHKLHMMYYKNQVPNLFYELKYDFTVYDQFIYDALVATISPFTIYSHRIFPAPTAILM